jgi:hypothetical protein
MEVFGVEPILSNGTDTGNTGNHFVFGVPTSLHQPRADNTPQKRLLAITLHVTGVDRPASYERTPLPHVANVHFLARVYGVLEQRLA